MQKMTKNQTQKAQPKMINLYTIVYRVFFEAFSCLYNFGACRRLAVSISKDITRLLRYKSLEFVIFACIAVEGPESGD